ncbi:hypothetical protein [Hoeflea prorocentri]|uniref:Uncharacterized protein n=1 Tax=Hoeflea prorocentri TaxID=1922333 RepID=A0A9X3UHM2_9HYPH|nr:hypothetical protein [Hoeflea prorocentri]MCY6381008.1 hypothetical protein [Hoeflea prorocentri]MDA5398808.1 hypothetical protein [Hoeflea prorocentri]
MTDSITYLVIDMKPLLNLYHLSTKHGVNGAQALTGRNYQIVILDEVLKELVESKRQVRMWLEKRPGVIFDRAKVNHTNLEETKRRFLPPPDGGIYKKGQLADTAIVKYISKNKSRTFTIISHDSDLIEWPERIRQALRQPGTGETRKGKRPRVDFLAQTDLDRAELKRLSKTHAHAGLPGFFLNEAVNGRLTGDQYQQLMKHTEIRNLSPDYQRVFTPHDIEALRRHYGAGGKEVFIGARHFARLDKTDPAFRSGGKTARDLGIVGLGSVGLEETVRRLGGAANVAEIGLVANEVQDHLKAGNEDEAFKTIVRFAAETVGGSAAGAAAAGAATVLAGAVGITLAPWALLATGVVAAMAGSLAVGEPAENLAADFARHMAGRHGKDDFTLDLLIEEARRFATGRGVDPDRFDEMLTPQKAGRLRALTENVEKGDRLPHRSPSEITLRGFTVDPSDPSYLVDDEAHYFNIRDGRGGEWQLTVDHKAIDNAPIMREDGHAFKRIEMDDGTFFYSPKSRSIYAYVPRLYPALQRGERAIDPPSAPSPTGFLEPASPHYDPEMKIDFFGRPMRAGDLVDGDPDVGDVSYYPGDSDGNLTSGPRRPRFRKVPIMDLLLKDGVLRNEHGEVIRASTGRPAGGVYDRFVNMQLMSDDGSPVEGRTGRSRVGARFIHSSGTDVGLGELFRHLQLLPDVDGDLRSPALGKRRQRQPLYWILHRELPSPEDYVLQRSGFEPGHVRRQLKAANRFVKTDGHLFGQRPPFAPVPTPRPDRPTPQTGPFPFRRQIL